MIVKVFNTEDGLQATIIRGTDMDDNPDLRVMKEEGDGQVHNIGASFVGCEQGSSLRDMVFMSVNSLEDLDALMEAGLDEWIRGLMARAVFEAKVDAMFDKAGRPH